MADEAEPFKPDFKRATVVFNEHLNKALLSKQAALKQQKKKKRNRKAAVIFLQGLAVTVTLTAVTLMVSLLFPVGCQFTVIFPQGPSGVIFIGDL